MSNARLTRIDEILDFMLSGKASMTLQSVPTGKHYSYKIVRAKPRPYESPSVPLRWWVSLLTGPDNSTDFQGKIGQLVQARGGSIRYARHRGVKLKAEAQPIAGFVWMLDQLVEDTNSSQLKLDEQILIYHSGRCGRCGRKLTDPESIRTGLGPVCRGKA